jgi:hypothetical protein
VDVARRPRKQTVRNVMIGASVLAIAGLFTWLSRLQKAAPTVDMAMVIQDSVKQGDMIREVRGASLRPAGDTLRYTNTGWAIGGSPREGAFGPIFYASGIVFPSPGRWLLIATSGHDWGCFIVTAS